MKCFLKKILITLDFSEIEEYPDELLALSIRKIMKKGEVIWFETKRGLPHEQISKLPKLISSISNAGGGIIFYGWDERRNSFANINPDQIQSVIIQQSKKCNPQVIIDFHMIKISNKKGLLVGIPSLGTPITNDNGSYYVRMGSHTSKIEKQNLLNSKEHFKKKLRGHLYLHQFQGIINSVKMDLFCEQVKFKIKSLEGFGNKLTNDIEKRWMIDFKDWLGESELSFPIRILFNKWIKNKTGNKSWKLNVEIRKWIKETLEILEIIEGNTNVDEIKKLIQDTSYRNANETNHRRCLSTLINQENIWNYTDARIFIYEENKKFILYQEEARTNVVTTIAEFESIDRKIVEEEILKHNKKKCIENTKKLLENISQELQKLIAIICTKQDF